jgi:hypothetical protein
MNSDPAWIFQADNSGEPFIGVRRSKRPGYVAEEQMIVDLALL